MKECKKCAVFIHGTDKICPLCQGKLDGDDDEPNFPNIDTVYKQHRFLFKLLILVTVSAGIISTTINMILPQTGVWALFVVLGIISFWLSMTIAFKNRNNVSKNILHQVVVISLMCVLWDYITGWNGWSLNYVFPIACTVALFSIAILSVILNMKNYKIYLITNIIIGFAPLVLYFTGIISISIPSLICTAISMIFFVLALLFYGNDIKKELSKSFHL